MPKADSVATTALASGGKAALASRLVAATHCTSLAPRPRRRSARSPFAVKYSTNNGASFINYFYALNQQGDVVKIFRPVAVKDADGNVIGYTEKTYATYTYDAWGKLTGILDSGGNNLINKQTTSTALANLNPLRYRGYYYDNETGFYYLQSRYYDPAVKRFINADSATATNVFDAIAYNMFAYCGNNPVVRTDASGNSWFSSLITAVAVVVVATVVAATVIASAGLVACAAVGVATSVGLSAGATAAVSTAATVGCYVVGGGIAACGLNDGMEIATGENYIRDKLLGGSQEAYDRVRTALSIATLAIGSLAEQAQAAGISCFIAGTSVVTADGQKPIEDIQVGDYVWAWDEETDDVALKQVVETYINETTELTHVFVNGEEIIATPTHPFYCPTKGWTDAARLRAGDILVLVNGEYVVVEKVQHELLENPVKVYNFQVADYHTYYVATGVLVNNSCTKQPGSYEIKTSDNRTYVGKGPVERMNASMRRLERSGYEIVDAVWQPARNNMTAFVDEYIKMSKYGFDFGGQLINKIMSPGCKIFLSWY